MEQELSVQERIKAIASRFKKCKYCFANWSQINTILDDVEEETPMILYVLPPSGTFYVNHGGNSLVDRPQTQIAFLIGTDFDFDGEENDSKIEQMKKLAHAFILAFNESGYFEMIDGAEITYQVPYDTTDDNVTGVILTLPIEETPKNMCDIKDMFGFE